MSSLPDNHMKKWTSEEDKDLLDKRIKGATIEALCKDFKRTTGSIKPRLYKFALKMLEDKEPLNEVATKLNFTEDEITEYQERQRERKELKEKHKKEKKTDKENKNKTNNEVLQDISAKLDKIIALMEKK